MRIFKCSKCENIDVAVTLKDYITNSFYDERVPEFLACNCRRCGHFWRDKTSDKLETSTTKINDVPGSFRYTDSEYTKINDWLVNNGFYNYVPDKGYLFKDGTDKPLSEAIPVIINELRDSNK